MREFEIRYKDSGEIDLLYGYSAKDLATATRLSLPTLMKYSEAGMQINTRKGVFLIPGRGSTLLII